MVRRACPACLSHFRRPVQSGPVRSSCLTKQLPEGRRNHGGSERRPIRSGAETETPGYAPSTVIQSVQSDSLAFCINVCPSILLSIHPYPSDRLSLSISPNNGISASPFLCTSLSVSPSPYPSQSVSVCPSLHIRIRLSLYQYVRLSISFIRRSIFPDELRLASYGPFRHIPLPRFISVAFLFIWRCLKDGMIYAARTYKAVFVFPLCRRFSSHRQRHSGRRMY